MSDRPPPPSREQIDQICNAAHNYSVGVALSLVPENDAFARELGNAINALRAWNDARSERIKEVMLFVGDFAGDLLHLGPAAGGTAATLDGVERILALGNLTPIISTGRPDKIHREAHRRGLVTRTIWKGETGERIEITRPKSEASDV